MSIKLDLTKFKHARSEGDHTVLVHKDGHELKVAHAKLSKEGQAQMAALANLSKDAMQNVDKKMAKGGKVEDKKKSPQTIYAHQAKDGVEAANAVREHGHDIPDGATIIVEGRHVDDKDSGKVKGPDGKKPEVFAEGGEVKHYAEGTSDVQSMLQPSLEDLQSGVAEQMAAMPTPEEVRYKKLSEDMALGSPGINPIDRDAAVLKQVEGEKLAREHQQQREAAVAEKEQQAMQANAQRKMSLGIPTAEGAAPAMPSAQEMPQQPMGVDAQASAATPLGQSAQPQQPQANAPGFGDAVGMYKQGFESQMQGINQQAQAQAGLGQEQAGILEQQQRAQADAKIAYQQKYNELEAERQAHMQDIKEAHINPEKYWTGDKDGNGSHSKVMSAIGMILAGFNPTSQPNAAINMLKTQMEQNLQAQKENLGAEQNLLTANLKQFGNLKDATDMTRVMQSDMVVNQLQMAAAKAATPMAQAAALQAAGKLYNETAPIAQNLAMRQAMMGLASGGGNSGNPSNTAAAEQMLAFARMTPGMEAQAKDMAERLLPGVGMAKIPVPDGVRQEMIHKQSLAEKAQDLLQYSKTHTNLVPGTPEYNYGSSKALALQQQVREGMLGGVFKESEKPLLEAFVTDNPAGAFKSFTTQPRLKAVIDSNAAGLNMLKKAYGLPITQAAPAGQTQDPKAAKAWATANINSPDSATRGQAEKILKVLRK